MSNFSIVVPIFNESQNIKKLVEEIYYSLKEFQNFELILVNDGSTDNTYNIIEQIKVNYLISVIENKTNLGQSFSICQGIQNSKYNTIVTIDGDGQNNPKDIPKLLEIFFSSNKISLVGGIRKNRKDNVIKILSSKLANKIRSTILNDNCVDTGCSLKIFDKNVFTKFSYFDGIHRFLPALFKGYGYKTIFVDVDHRPRVAGVSKYGTFERLIKGIKDLIKVKYMIDQLKK